jgi:hypothetical protein
LIRRILEDKGGKEVPILITYLIPFTFNPIYMVNALRQLDKQLFPKLQKYGTVVNQIVFISFPFQ